MEANLLGNLELGVTKHQILAGYNYLDNDNHSLNSVPFRTSRDRER